MKIRRYTCKDMQEAMLKVKMDLGSEAVIMNSRKVKPKGLKGLFSKPMIEVVAAIDDDYVRPSRSALYNKKLTEARKVVTQNNSITLSDNKLHDNEDSKSEFKGNGLNVNTEHIAELESKVKNMEDTLKKIYQSLQARDDIKKALDNYDNVKKTETEVINRSHAEAWQPLKPQTAQSEQESDIKMPKDQNKDLLLNTQRVLEVHNKSVDEYTDDFAALKKLLFNQDIEPKLIEKILKKIRERGANSPEAALTLAQKILTVLLGKPEPLEIKEKQPHVAIFIGPTGVGKTTTLAKIAAEFSLNRQKKVGLITADTYRIAAIEQLKTYAEILNIPLNVVYSPDEIKDAVSELADKDLILVDTAGRSHKNKAHFDELKSLVGAVNADETYLVLSCNSSPKAVKETLEYYAFIKKFKLIFTKLDESPALGIIFNARYMTGKPLSYTTAGQSVPDDLDIADPKQLATEVCS